MKSFPILLLALACSAVIAADSTTLVIPKVMKPLVEPVEDDRLQADYDKMWVYYEQAIEMATAKVKEALEKQATKATDSGDLDFVEVWEGMKKNFDESGTLEWDTSPKAGVEWRKKYPQVPFPREFNEGVRAAATLVDDASKKLEEGYADLVKAYTKAKNIKRAKELRDELAGLLAGGEKPQAPAGVAKQQAPPPPFVGKWTLA